jgi:HD-GYP domain-containing protein (c-di-GMP phosphodiesterase class II)
MQNAQNQTQVEKPAAGVDALVDCILCIVEQSHGESNLNARGDKAACISFLSTRLSGGTREEIKAVVYGLVSAVEAKDPHTAGHSERVMRYSLSIGRAVGLSSRELQILELGTLVHDVGKICVPDEILNKPAKLDEVEYAIIKTHPEIGARLVRGIPVFEDCLAIIESHHERLDGRGYPHGLSSDEIPIMVRIASVSDVFDALTSRRAYREAMPIEDALAILRKDADAGALDRKIVEVLADIVKRDGVLWAETRNEAA